MVLFSPALPVWAALGAIASSLTVFGAVFNALAAQPPDDQAERRVRGWHDRCRTEAQMAEPKIGRNGRRVLIEGQPRDFTPSAPSILAAAACAARSTRTAGARGWCGRHRRRRRARRASGCPIATVKLPSEPPPTSGALSSTKPISRAMAAARSKTRSTPRSRANGGRVMLPVTVISISGRDDLSARIFASISLALARSQTRRSTSIMQSSATVFLAVPPSIRPTLVVMPRARSFKPSIASAISAMARMALRPLSG